MKEVVASGRTVEEAKREALKELGVDSEEFVEIEIIDEGSKGVFGWGTKFARVKVRLVKEPEVKEEKELKDPIKEKLAKPEKKRQEKVSMEKAKIPEPFEEPKKELPPITVGEIPPITVGEQIKETYKSRTNFEKKKEYYRREREKLEESSVELLQDEEGGPYSPREVIKNILKYMGLEGEVNIKRRPSGIVYNIEGKDLGMLIGKHGQTLEALQFIVNLIILKKGNRKSKITIDVEGYRARRERNLRDMALRMAEKARRERKNIVLEPMLPSERRIIHLALQNNPHVTTYSKGEEPMRKVIIAPKKRTPRR